MEFFQKNVLQHITSWHFPVFCGAIAIGHYFGKKVLNRYAQKKGIVGDMKNTRYFLMHFCFNVCSTLYTYRNMIDTINNPLAIQNESNVVSFYNVLFHLYHSLFYWNSIRFDEKVHHILSVFILCPSTWMHYTNLCNLATFFMIGLPGCVSYLLLSLRDLNLVDSMVEKRISKHMNLWVRAPGTVLSSYIIYLNYISGSFGQTTLVTKLAIFLAIGTTYWNGMYFAGTITESYAIAKYKRDLRGDF